MKTLRQGRFGEPETPNSSSDHETAVVEAVLRKDRKATAEFVALYADALYRYIRSRLAPQYDHVDDLVQEVFLAAWEGLGQYRRNGPLQAWLIGIARHKVEDYYRKRLRAPEPLEDAGLIPDVSATASEFHQLLEQDQLRKRIWQVMETLSETHRLALMWRYWDGASAREMSLKTGKTEKAIERLLARARSDFRERWNYGQSF